MKTVLINLSISAEEFLALYEGSAENVLCYSLDGRRVRFPAAILRRFVTHNGVHGVFRIAFDEHNRYQGIEKID